MMGFRDPRADEDLAAYWDEYLQEFGPAAYVEERYIRAQEGEVR